MDHGLNQLIDLDKMNIELTNRIEQEVLVVGSIEKSNSDLQSTKKDDVEEMTRHELLNPTDIQNLRDLAIQGLPSQSENISPLVLLIPHLQANNRCASISFI